MKITINVSGKVAKKANKRDHLNYGKYYIEPINKRGMEPYVEFEGSTEQIEKALKGFFENLEVKPHSRNQRYISRRGEKNCFYLTLDSYKVLAPYMRKFGYLS